MNREEALNVWAPAESPWSPWVKAVLFTYMPEEIAEEGPAADGPGWPVPPGRGNALVVELPGSQGVEVGVALARSGYRPVPLYNACPAPSFPARVAAMVDTAEAVACMVDVRAIQRALERQTAALRRCGLPPSAPPAFLLDANRRRWSPGRPLDSRLFDNRSIVRESDLPTAMFLQAQGIREVVCVQAAERRPPVDLVEVLRAWQRNGMTVARQQVGQPWEPRVFTVGTPGFLRRGWEWLLRQGYAHNVDGTFGRLVPGAG